MLQAGTPLGAIGTLARVCQKAQVFSEQANSTKRLKNQAAGGVPKGCGIRGSDVVTSCTL